MSARDTQHSPSRQGRDGAEEGGVLPRDWHRAVVGVLSLRQVVQETQLWAATRGREVSEVLPHFSAAYLAPTAPLASRRAFFSYRRHAGAE